MKCTIIFPCLNESDSIGMSVIQAWNILKYHEIDGEIIVVDNGSTDNSAYVVKSLQNEYNNLHYAHEEKKGYGNAYLKGLSLAKGKYIIMVDPDGSYDLTMIPRFLFHLEQNDLVVGNRFANIKKGAMPFINRYFWNNLLRMLLHSKGLELEETCTGFIGVHKSFIDSLNLKSEGMEFSTELLVKSHDGFSDVEEIPITYHCRVGRSKVMKFQDGMRHLNYLLSTEKFK